LFIFGKEFFGSEEQVALQEIEFVALRRYL